MKKGILVTGLILLFITEFSQVYFIMPFPGSQKMESLPFAYWLHNNILWIRIVLLALVLFCLLQVFKSSAKWFRLTAAALLLCYAIVFYFVNFKFRADKMFYQPKTKVFASNEANVVDGKKLVLGVSINGEAKAYPIQVIGYHHQVRDTIGGVSAIVTYCTVCRTGRVFRPEVDGQPENFRLVGMDHFNAMFEDSRTKSWWQQATGVAVAGPLKGKTLPEIPFEQASLASWLTRYPATLILQPDTIFNKQYESLKDFDNGTTKDALEKRDSASWQFKSWVIGVERNGSSKAYDWNMLVEKQMIQDSISGLPLLLTIENDTSTFHVLNRRTDSFTLQFNIQEQGFLTDIQTNSRWNTAGVCVEGTLKGARLAKVPASQEFWHSWKTFHPKTVAYH